MRDARAFFHHKFCHIGIGNGQRLHGGDVGLEHHLINVAGGKGLLIDDGADVEAFGHRDIIGVFHHRHGFAHAEALGGQASENVGLGIVGEGEKSLCVSYALVDEGIRGRVRHRAR